MAWKRYRRLALAAVGICTLAGGLAMAREALAQPVPCGDRAEIVAKLAGEYGEQPVFVALTAAGNVVEVWMAAAGGWTLLTTPGTGGPTCIVGAGRSSVLLEVVAPLPGAPT